jgi:hypothetical protein
MTMKMIVKDVAVTVFIAKKNIQRRSEVMDGSAAGNA